MWRFFLGHGYSENTAHIVSFNTLLCKPLTFRPPLFFFQSNDQKFLHFLERQNKRVPTDNSKMALLDHLHYMIRFSDDVWKCKFWTGLKNYSSAGSQYTVSMSVRVCQKLKQKRLFPQIRTICFLKSLWIQKSTRNVHQEVKIMLAFWLDNVISSNDLDTPLIKPCRESFLLRTRTIKSLSYSRKTWKLWSFWNILCLARRWRNISCMATVFLKVAKYSLKREKLRKLRHDKTTMLTWGAFPTLKILLR